MDPPIDSATDNFSRCAIACQVRSFFPTLNPRPATPQPGFAAGHLAQTQGCVDSAPGRIRGQEVPTPGASVGSVGLLSGGFGNRKFNPKQNPMVTYW